MPVCTTNGLRSVSQVVRQEKEPPALKSAEVVQPEAVAIIDLRYSIILKLSHPLNEFVFPFHLPTVLGKSIAKAGDGPAKPEPTIELDEEPPDKRVSPFTPFDTLQTCTRVEGQCDHPI